MRKSEKWNEYLIKSHDLTFVGLCPECAKKKPLNRIEIDTVLTKGEKYEKHHVFWFAVRTSFFLIFQGEAQYLHGHTGVLTIEVEDTIEPGVNMVFPCNEIRKTAWEVLKNFDHALILREDDPLLPAILAVYDAQGIRNGAPSNRMKGAPVKTDLITCYPDCRLVVTKETLTTEGMIKIAYDLLKDKLNIAKITFTSGVNAASQEYKPQGTVDRCPLCGIALDENGVCPKCGYRK